MTQVGPEEHRTETADERGHARAPGDRRVLAVGDGTLGSRVREAIAEAGEANTSVIEVSDYLAAMGELSRGGVDAIVGPADRLAGMEHATAEAIRRLCPGARLLAVVPDGANGQATRLKSAGFDHCLTEPLERDALLEALNASGDSPSQPEAGQDGDARLGRDASTRPAVPIDTADAATDEASTSGGELGDVDLLDAVLAERGELPGRAMQLLRETSGLGSLGLIERAADAPAGHVTAAVTYEGEPFGVLHAEAPAPRLEAWAGWLGRWLAMNQRVRSYHELAMRDELTGVWNRRYFHQFLERVLPWAQRDRSQVTVLVFDIDDFKLYNDQFGHPAGDDILISVGGLMQSLVRDHDVVARIGGDEFAVIFWEAEGPRKSNSRHPSDVLEVAHRFQDAVCQHRFPKLLDEAASTLTISGGLASFPWDGRTVEELVAHADANALTSKRQGKNVITFGPGACGMDHPDYPSQGGHGHHT